MFRSQFIFYLLFIYIFAFFIWWTYYLLSLNRRIFERDMVLIELTESPADTKGYVTDEYTKAVRMIVSEGAVFLLLLALGFWKVRKSFLKERFVSRQQNNFLLSVTHELKSPLSSIKLSLQTITKRNLEPDKQEKLVSNSLQDVKRLETLVDNMLLATRIESKGYIYSRQYFNISELLRQLTERVQSAYEHERNFIVNIEPGIQFKGDETAISSVLQNLLENGVKYSDRGDTINVLLQLKNNKICLEVADTGIGVPGKEKENIFKRFYRIGNEEIRKTQGTGLGLFIAKQVTEDHGGKITVRNNNLKGTVFAVTLPHERENPIS